MAARPFKLYDQVRVTKGPLTGCCGIVHELSDNGKPLTVLIEVDDEIFPPLPFAPAHLSVYLGHMGFRLFLAAYVTVFFVINQVTRTRYVLCLIAATIAMWLPAHIYLCRKSKEAKTCTSCGHPLDSESSYSTCTACKWTRPMPAAGEAHLKWFSEQS